MTVDRDRGELAILLHSHMPYVEGFGTWPFGEEWLFEAAASTYVPLLEQCERWADQETTGVLTVGVTPVLSDQLVLPDVAERLVRFVRDVRSDCHRLDIDGLERAGDSKAADALRESARDYEHAADYFEELDRDLIGALRRFRDAGVIDLWASAATHAILPLLAT
jgi:1,4-alpha-glucan branching enzyme